MKSFFRLIIVLFIMALSILVEPPTLQAEQVDYQGAIKNLEREAVVLVSNNIFGGTITTCQENDQETFSNLSPQVLLNLSNELLLNKNKTLTLGCFIHNLSTDKKNIHLIRAP